jgi:hypothetical protein
MAGHNLEPWVCKKAELLELCSTLPLRHLPGLMSHRKLILKEGNFPDKAFGILMSRG